MSNKRLEALRNEMNERQLDAFIIFGTDPHKSENVSPRWRSREWISGFTGSAGTIVITREVAGLWTDSRYFLQADEQVKDSDFSVFKVGLEGVLDYTDWLSTTLAEGSSVGVSADEISVSLYRTISEALKGKVISLIPSEDLLDIIWDGRPAIPHEPIRELPLSVTGSSREEKISEVRKIALKKGSGSVLLTSLDDIAWLMNLRGGDVDHNLLFMSYCLITQESVFLFGNIRHLSAVKGLADQVQLMPYGSIFNKLKEEMERQSSLYISPDKVNMELFTLIPATVSLIEGRDITTDLKCVKNETELEGMRQAHRQDGAALVSFLHWLDTGWDSDNQPLDEVLFAERLLTFREQRKTFLEESFSPIVGFKDHGALNHYSATPETAYPITGDGLMVLDSGGQYTDGTTDITRTLLFGKATQQQIDDYTAVLKGHLSLGSQHFPDDTCGYQLDAIARMWLWNEGKQYRHGTGHGVGHMLNVHEGPHVINQRPINVPLKRGMVVSNEPGVYREGSHGIRIENLVYVDDAESTEFGHFLTFRDLTFCHYEKRLINKAALDDTQKAQIDRYHESVYTQLKDLVTEEVADWLKEKTMPL